MIEIAKNKDDSKLSVDIYYILLSLYAESINRQYPKYYVKNTGREYRGTIYLQEGIGLTNSFGELLELR